MTRYRDSAHHTLTPAEILELRLGCAADRESLFTSAADQRAALAALAELDAGRHDVALLIEEGETFRELRRRHLQHFAHDDDPQYPATFHPVGCARCNPAGYRTVSDRMRDAQSASSLYLQARSAVRGAPTGRAPSTRPAPVPS